MIKYQNSIKGISAKQLKGFFIGWKNSPSAETHLKLLRNSYKVILAINIETENVVGFITTISDGVLSAYIPFLEVLPKFQNKNIGSQLVKRMLKKLEGFYMIDLICDPELEGFYKEFGMKGSIGMILRNYDKQSGK